MLPRRYGSQEFFADKFLLFIAVFYIITHYIYIDCIHIHALHLRKYIFIYIFLVLSSFKDVLVSGE